MTGRPLSVRVVRMLYEVVAALAGSWQRDKCSGTRLGLVVGATDIDALTRVREVVPDMWILAPGG